MKQIRRLRCRTAMVVFTILSTIARISGGTYEPILRKTKEWQESWSRKQIQGTKWNPLKKEEEISFEKEYLTDMLMCGKPSSVSYERWMLKCLSNDQTSFTGFTSLVDIADGLENKFGYDGQIKLKSAAAFLEPFVLQQCSEKSAMCLTELKNELETLDSMQTQRINEIIKEAETIYPEIKGRSKGKSPIFFYGISDKPFLLPEKIYERMVAATNLAYESIAAVSENFSKGMTLEQAMSEAGNFSRQIFTGSIDFMIYGDEIYIIDIGAPAVGYVADMLATKKVLCREADFGAETLAKNIGNGTILRNKQSYELGFFKQEKEVLISALAESGIDLKVNDGEIGEVMDSEGKILPTDSFDYLSRNQLLRNRIFGLIKSELNNLGVKIPQGAVLIPDDFELPSFYNRTKLENLNVLIKKKVLFREYSIGNGYYKPLVVPLWSSEIRADKCSNLFEQFIPSLMDIDIAGDISGKRCYEIRMYFCAKGD